MALADTGGTKPLLIKEVQIPNAQPGDFDQMAVDLRRDRLFASAESSNLVEIFALRSGQFLGAISDVKKPHRLAVEEGSGNILLADGGQNEVKLFNRHGKFLASVPTGEDPDGGVLDTRQNVFYVGSRVISAEQKTSQIQAINVKTMRIISTIDIPASTLKGMVIDDPSHMLFVSMRDKNAVGEINLDTQKLVSVLSPPGLTLPVPLALDQKAQLLFVGARRPGKLFVLDAKTGAELQVLDSTNISDSMWFDPQNNQIYVSGHGGESVYRVGENRSVYPVALIDTHAGKTSILVDTLHRLYVIAPKAGKRDAELLIYKLN